MKKILPNPATVKMLATFIFLIGASMLKASETHTNWDWVNLGLVIPQTNLFIGDKIPVSVVASNAVENEHILRWYVGDPCNSGLGKFSIVEVSSGKQIQCRLTREERAELYGSYRTFLKSHKSKVFETDLTKGYVITNAGLYSVQVEGWFPINEPPTNNQYTTMITPPIFIHLSPRAETNAPPK